MTVLKKIAFFQNRRDEVPNREIFPHLLLHLRTCRAKDVPQHSEQIVQAVNPENKQAFLTTLEKRMPEINQSQAARLKKVLKQHQV